MAHPGYGFNCREKTDKEKISDLQKTVAELTKKVSEFSGCDNFKAKKREFKVGDKVNCVYGNGEVVTTNVWHSFMNGQRFDRACIYVVLGNGGLKTIYTDSGSLSLIK